MEFDRPDRLCEFQKDKKTMADLTMKLLMNNDLRLFNTLD